MDVRGGAGDSGSSDAARHLGRIPCRIATRVTSGISRSTDCFARSGGKCVWVSPGTCTPDAGPAGDGRHTDYLERREEWRHLDPELFDLLKKLVTDGARSVKSVEESGILGDTVFAAEPLDVSAVPFRDREHWRHQWFGRVVRRLSGCNLILADPDNGLVSDDCFKPATKRDAKRIPLAEALSLAEGRAAIIYHHNGRRPGGHHREIREWADRLPGCRFAWYWRRASNRTFFIINPDSETEHLLMLFAERWRDCGQLITRTPATRIVIRADNGTESTSAAPNESAPRRPPFPRSVRLQVDPVVESYKRDVDRTLLRQNLRRSVTERVANLSALLRLAEEARRAGRSRENAT